MDRADAIFAPIVRIPAILFSVLALYLLPACGASPIHKAGERMWTANLEYGRPTRGKTLAWTGLGSADTYSISGSNYWFLSDRLSMGAGLTLTAFDQKDGWVSGIEPEALLRWHFAETESVSFFADGAVGFLYTSKSVPENSTDWNFTFSFGPGVEIPLSDSLKLISKFEFHHLSNAKGRQTVENESQNEGRFTIGIGMSW